MSLQKTYKEYVTLHHERMKLCLINYTCLLHTSTVRDWPLFFTQKTFAIHFQSYAIGIRVKSVIFSDCYKREHESKCFLITNGAFDIGYDKKRIVSVFFTC